MMRGRCPRARAFGLALLLLGVGACPADDVGGEGSDDAPATGEALVCQPQPLYNELYSSCTGVQDCGRADYVCAYQVGTDPATAPAFCTGYCTLDVHCPAVGDCAATPICLTPSAGGTSVCALDCGDDRPCPEGMECLEDEDNGGVRYLCF